MRPPAALARKTVFTVAPVLAALLVLAANAGAATGPRPSAIVWGNGVFSSRATLADWLKSRGASYNRWARRHPDARAVLEHRRAAPKTARARSDSTFAAPAAASNSRVTHWTRLGETLLLAVAALAMLLALLPAPRLAIVGDGLSITQRAYVFAVGLAVCVGVGIAFLRA